MKKRAISFLMVLCMLLSLLPTAAFGAEDDGDDCASEGYSLSDKTDDDVVPEVVEPASQFTILRSDIDAAAFVEPAVPVLQGITCTDAERPTKLRRSAPVYTTDLNVAAELLRERMKARESEIHVYYQVEADAAKSLEDIAAAAAADIYEQALKHTGVGNEGDYLRWSIYSVGQNVDIWQDGDTCFLDVTHYLSYYTTVEQEDELLQRVNGLKPLLRLDEDISDYQKLTNIYHYICGRIVYDYEHVFDDVYLLQQSAYAALVHGTAVCQGYATLLYLLTLEAGIDCRILVGESQGIGHAWNIAQIDGLYYFLDSTWDAGTINFQYYLKSRQDFPDHAEYLEYLEEEFYIKHPIASTSYVHPEIPLRKEGEFEYSVSAGSATLVKYTGSEKDVVVPAYLGGYPVYRIGSSAFVGNGTMETLTFSEGIALIGSESIMTCTALKTLYFPSTLNLISYDGPIVISGASSVPVACNQLREVVVAEGNPHITIYEGALYSADMKELLYLPPADPRETLRIPEGVEKIGSDSCRDNANLREVIMPDTVTIIGYWSFMDDYNLQKLNISKACIFMGQYTLQNTILSSIHIPATLTVIAPAAFGHNCYLESISADPENPVYYAKDNILYGWSETGQRLLVKYPAGSTRTQFEVPEGVQIIDWYAFASAKNLEYVRLPDSVQTIAQSAFFDCLQLEKIRFSQNLQEIGDSAFWDCLSLTLLQLPAGLTTIGEYAFANGNLISLVIPDSVLSIGNRAFALSHRSLHHVLYTGTAAQWDNISIESGNEALTNGIRHNEYSGTDICEDIHLRSRCTIIEVSCDICGEQGAIRKTSGSVPGHQFSNGVCSACQVPEAFKYIFNDPVTAVTIIGYHGNTASVEVPETIEGVPVVAIDDYVFQSHEEIKEVVLPDSITSLGISAFYGCTSLERVNLPDHLVSIGEEVFGLCHNLTTVVLPKDLAVIPAYAFSFRNYPIVVTFTGDVPTIADNAFMYATVTAYYPVNNNTWTEDVMQQYGGTVTWKPSCATAHKEVTVPGKAATCTEPGLTDGKKCSDCGTVTVAQKTIAAKGHKFTNGTCTVCGAKDPNYFEPSLTGATRIFGADRYETAFKTAEVLKQQLGVEKFDNIVVACGDNFADALGGSYLAAKKNAPILLVKSSKIDAVKSYIKANLNPGGTVYLLGGTAAIPAAMDTGLDGFTVRRLAGATRYDTNLLILEEAGVTNEDILICTGKNFADSLSAAAAGRPILLVKDSLNDSQKAFLQSHAANKKYILGGTAAVSTSVENQAKAYGTVKRIGGNTRYETSVLIAQEFFPDATQAALAYAQNFPDGLSGGALAYAMKAPLVLTASGKEAAAAAYAKEQGITSGVILGGNVLISDKAVRTIFQMQSGDVIKLG